MDHKALAETYVDLWLYIDKDLEKKASGGLTNETVNMVFEQTCKRIISDLIGKQRSSVPHKQESSSDDKPTEKQIAWALKLGCHKPERFSKKEHKSCKACSL